MNYNFQRSGLIAGDSARYGRFTYSWVALPSLDEKNLDENKGINGGTYRPELEGYGTKYVFKDAALYPSCNYRTIYVASNQINSAIDWNFNGSLEPNIEADISHGEGRSLCIMEDSYDTLVSITDWDRLDFKKGGIGYGTALEDYYIEPAAIEEPFTLEEDLSMVHAPPPTGLTASAGTKMVRLAWRLDQELIEGGTLKRYNVYRKGPAGEFELVGSTSSSAFDDHSVLVAHQYIYGVRAVDYVGNESEMSDAVAIELADTSKPILVPVADKTRLWPPNHAMVDVTIMANASDDSGWPVALSTVAWSSEPENGLGDGDMAPDWTEPVIDEATGAITLQLRSERSGSGVGREYTVTITATDTSGNWNVADVKIIVPHDMKKK